MTSSKQSLLESLRIAFEMPRPVLDALLTVQTHDIHRSNLIYQYHVEGFMLWQTTGSGSRAITTTQDDRFKHASASSKLCVDLIKLDVRDERKLRRVQKSHKLPKGPRMLLECRLDFLDREINEWYGVLNIDDEGAATMFRNNADRLTAVTKYLAEEALKASRSFVDEAFEAITRRTTRPVPVNSSDFKCYNVSYQRRSDYVLVPVWTEEPESN